MRACQLEIAIYPMDVPLHCHIEISEYSITLPDFEIKKVQAIINNIHIFQVGS